MSNVFQILDEDYVEEQEETTEEWRKYWKGMPEFVQEDNPPYKKIIVSFRNEEDYEEFAKLISQKLTDKTKSIWYPKLDIDDNALKRWIEE
jgi:hypothetical protein